MEQPCNLICPGRLVRLLISKYPIAKHTRLATRRPVSPKDVVAVACTNHAFREYRLSHPRLRSMRKMPDWPCDNPLASLRPWPLLAPDMPRFRLEQDRHLLPLRPWHHTPGPLLSAQLRATNRSGLNMNLRRLPVRRHSHPDRCMVSSAESPPSPSRVHLQFTARRRLAQAATSQRPSHRFQTAHLPLHRCKLCLRLAPGVYRKIST